jgi:hypothetical protein
VSTSISIYLLIKEVRFLPRIFVRFLCTLGFQSNLQRMPPLKLQNDSPPLRPSSWLHAAFFFEGRLHASTQPRLRSYVIWSVIAQDPAQQVTATAHMGAFGRLATSRPEAHNNCFEKKPLRSGQHELKAGICTTF